MTAPVSTAGTDDGPRPLGWPTWTLIAVLLVPLLAGAVHLVVDLGGYRAVNDNALNELVVRSMSRHLPTLGPFARNDWSHPGPLMYDVLWPAYQVFGSDSAAMAVGALIVNSVALATIVALGRRWGGWELAVPLALAGALITVHLPHEYLTDPWNPSLTVLPFGAFLFLAWSATCGDGWALPAAAFAASFCLQSHVGYLTLVVPVLAWAVVRAWYLARGDRARSARYWKWLAGSAGALAVVWAPPVYQQLTGSPGNLGQIFHYFRTSSEPAHSLLDGWRLVAAQFTVTADWITGARTVTTIEPPALHQTPVPLLLVAVLAATWLTWRRWRPLRELATVLLVTIGFGIIGLSRTLGPMYDYRLRWIWVLAGLATAFVVAVVWRSATALHSQIARTVTAVVAGTAMLALTVIATSHLADVEPHHAEVLRTDVVGRGIVRAVRSGHGPVILRAASYGGYIAIAGTMLRLADAGVPAQVDDDSVQARLGFGAERIHRHGPVRAVVVLASGDAIAKLRAQPGVRQVAFASGALGHPHDDRSRTAIRNDDLAAFIVPTTNLPGDSAGSSGSGS